MNLGLRVAFMSLTLTIPVVEMSFDILAIFSIGECKDVNNVLCSEARNEKHFRKNHEEINKRFQTNHRLCTKDVNTQNNLLNELLPFAYNNKVKLDSCINSNTDIDVDPKLTFIVTQMSFELTRLASAMLIPLGIPLIAITFKSMYPAAYFEHGLFIYSYETSFGKVKHETAVKKLMGKLGVSYAGFFSINNGTQRDNKHRKQLSCNEHSKNAFCIYSSFSNGICGKERYIDIQDQKEIQTALKIADSDPNLAFIMLYAKNNLLRRFKYILNTKFKNYTQRFFFLDFEKDTYKKTTSYYQSTPDTVDVIHDVPGENTINFILYFIYGFKNHLFSNPDVIDFLRQNLIVKSKLEEFIEKNRTFLPSQINYQYFMDHWTDFNEKERTFIFSMFETDFTLKLTLINLWKNRFYIDLVNITRLKEQQTFNPFPFMWRRPYCNLTKPSFCKQGKELVHSFYKEVNWDNSYGWNCKKCQQGFYKNENDTSKCIKCQDKNITNDERTFCYDPYEDLFLKIDFQNLRTIFLALFAGFQCVSIILVFVVYLRYHKTPIVLSSDFHMSMLQLIIHFLLALAPFFLYSGLPDTVKCVFRPVVVGVGFTIIIALNISKTQKILLIYTSKTRMSRKQIILTKATEWFIIAIMLLIDLSIVAVTLQYSSPDREITYDEEKLIREYHCNNNVDVLVQFLFAFIIVFFNGIQGIRARNLPSEFREIMHLTYSSFTSSIVLIAAAFVYFTQTSEYAKTTVLVITVYVMNSLHFVLLYIYKLFIILCRPQLNTKKAFEQKRMQKINNGINSS